MLHPTADARYSLYRKCQKWPGAFIKLSHTWHQCKSHIQIVRFPSWCHVWDIESSKDTEIVWLTIGVMCGILKAPRTRYFWHSDHSTSARQFRVASLGPGRIRDLFAQILCTYLADAASRILGELCRVVTGNSAHPLHCGKPSQEWACDMVIWNDGGRYYFWIIGKERGIKLSCFNMVFSVDKLLCVTRYSILKGFDSNMYNLFCIYICTCSFVSPKFSSTLTFRLGCTPHAGVHIHNILYPTCMIVYIVCVSNFVQWCYIVSLKM